MVGQASELVEDDAGILGDLSVQARVADELDAASASAQRQRCSTRCRCIG
jgi:hypothetical protein